MVGRFRLDGLGARLLLTYATLVLLALSLLALSLVFGTRTFYGDQITKELAVQARILSLQVRSPLAAGDRAALADLLRTIAAQTQARVLVFDAHGVVLAATESADVPLVGQAPPFPGVDEALAGRESTGKRFWIAGGTDVCYVNLPVFAEGGGPVLGVVRVSYGLADIQQYQRGLVVQLLIAIVLATAVAAVVGIRFAQSIARPLGAVRDALRRIGAGQRDVQAPIAGPAEVRQVAADVNALVERLAVAEQDRRTFAAEVSHDIRSLAGGIASAVQVLQPHRPMYEGRARALQLLDSLKGQTARLARLTDDLLLIADAEAADYRPVLAPLSLDDLVARVVAEGRPRAELRELALTCEPISCPLQVVADEGLVARAVANLLDNAITYTPPGGQIVVRLAEEGGRAAVRVSDTGPGLRPGEQELVFARAYRGEAGSARRGHGLGLAIVKRAADLHAGEVRAESAPGGGTTFTLLLPASAPPPPEEAS